MKLDYSFIIKVLTGWLGKIGISIGVFVAPISSMLWVIFALIILDMITSVMKQWKEKKLEGKKLLLFPIPFYDGDREIVFRSSEAKKTMIKTFLYITFISVCYALPYSIMEFHMYMPHIATACIGSVELVSIAENNSVTTNNSIFVKITKVLTKKLNSYISDKTQNNK